MKDFDKTIEPIKIQDYKIIKKSKEAVIGDIIKLISDKLEVTNPIQPDGSFRAHINSKSKIKTDGFIITNKNGKISYKSKFKSTVDLKYKKGYLLLENEDISERIPKTKYKKSTNIIYIHLFLFI